jgi:hypothetical protein
MRRHVAALALGFLVVGAPACRCGGAPAPAPAPASPAWPRTTVIDSWGQGTHRIDLVRYQPSPRDDLFQLRHGDAVILDAPGRVIGVVAALPDRAQPRFLLAELDHGGNACPLHYRLVDLRGDLPRLGGEEFGTCWRLRGEPVEVNGAVRVELFADRAGSSSATAWITDGKAVLVPTVKAPSREPVKPSPAPAR